MTTARRPAALLVALAFTVSGFTSLVLEVVWSKALAQLLGSTLYSVSTVVAAYLGGLALGAWLCGRVVHRVARPLRLYGLLEAGIGLYALASLAVIHALDPLVGRAYAALGPASPVYLAVRVGLAVLVLVVPTVLMGATLPALVAWAGRSGGDFGKSLGRLYGLNTAGAVAGAALAGFRLIPGLGLTGTTRAAGAVALAVGASMIFLGSRAAASARAREGAIAHAAGPPAGGSRGLAIALFGLSGAAALVLEITWTRVFSLVFGSSVYSFALVLASYLLALALGSLFWGGRLADGPRPWRAFALLQIAAAAGAAVGLWALPNLPRLFLTVLFENRQNLTGLYLLQTGLASIVTFLPCLAFGALFPVGTRLVAASGMEGARATGLSYAINTAGTLTGSLLAGFVLLPTVGIRTTWVGAAILSLVLGVVAWRVSVTRETRAAAPAKGKKKKAGTASDALWVPAAAAVALLALASPPWNRSLFTLGVFRTAFLLTGGTRTAEGAVRNMEYRLGNDEVLFYREGLHGVVSVHADKSYPDVISLRVNGKPDASTGGDIGTQVFLGHVPMLWAPPHARVCVIGQGSGVTARAVLAHDPERLTVVEIEPAVIQASHWFDAYTDTVLADPRVELILEDGRQHLLHSGRHYDVIVSEPSNPWIAGVNNLFTTDFYRRVRSDLNPGGVFCQWVQFYELSQTAQSSLLRSFAQVFPEGEAFFVNYDFLLVAPPPGGKVTADRLFPRDHPDSPVARYLHRFQLDGDGAVASIHLGRVRSLVAQLPPAPLNTDDRPFIEYRAPIDLYQVPIVRDVWETADPRPLDGLGRWVDPAALPRAAGAAGLSLARMGQIERARKLAREVGEAGGPEAQAAAADIARGAERADVERRIALLVDQGNQALDANDLAGAERAVQGIFQTDSMNVQGHLMRGRMAMRHDDFAEARRQLDIVYRRGEDREKSAARNNLGIIALREGHPDVGRAEFEAARRLAPAETNSYLFLARLLAESGKTDSAEVVLTEGMRQVRGRAELARAVLALRAGEKF